MNKRIINLCNKVINYGLSFLVFLIAISFCLKSYDSLYIKSTLLQIGATIVVAAWLIKIIEEKQSPFTHSSMSILLPVLAFLLSGIISYLFVSPFKVTSLEELLLRIPYFGIFLVAFFEFSDFKKIRRLIFWFLGAGLFVSIYGLLQHFELDPFGWAGGHGGRIFSTFGNPNFYSGYLVIIIPLALISFFGSYDSGDIKKIVPYLRIAAWLGLLYYIIQLTQKPALIRIGIFGILLLILIRLGFYFNMKGRIFPVVFMFIIFVNVLLASSRSGYIGFAAGVISFVFLSIIFVSKTRKRNKVIFLTVFTVIVLILTLSGVTYIGQQRRGSVAERKYIILAAMDLIKEHPVLGNGLGTFKIKYPGVRKLGVWVVQERCNVQCRDVYNEYLEVWQDEGLIGLGIFLWLLATIFIRGIKRLRSYRDDRCEISLQSHYYTIGLLSAIFGLLISNVFSLNMRYVSSGFYFWLLLALAGAHVLKSDTGKTEKI